MVDLGRGPHDACVNARDTKRILLNVFWDPCIVYLLPSGELLALASHLLHFAKDLPDNFRVPAIVAGLNGALNRVRYVRARHNISTDISQTCVDPVNGAVCWLDGAARFIGQFYARVVASLRIAHILKGRETQRELLPFGRCIL